MQNIVKSLVIPAAILSTANVALAQSEKPNVIVVLIDDAGYSDMGFMGCEDVRTPNIDALASKGRIFTDAHVAASVSSPSRAMLLTGRQGQRFGYECNLAHDGTGVPSDEEILPSLLKRVGGYSTSVIGKWHLGALDWQHPNKKGVDTFYGLIGGSRDYYYSPNGSDSAKSHNKYEFNGTPRKFDGYFTDELTDRAVDVINDSDSPFMMYLSYTAPHSPNQAKPEDLELFKGKERAVYAAMVWAVDRGIGKIVGELEKSGKLDNTVIFFLSDNGGSTTNTSANLPLKGFKGNKFEGGHRVPFFAVWGDRWQNSQKCDGLTSSLDIFATVVDVLDIPKSELNKPIDGVSLLPWLEGDSNKEPHKELYWRKMDSRAVRYGDYKLTMTHGVDTVMYNLKNEISEMTNLIETEPKMAKKLIGKLEKWEKESCIDPTWIEEGWAETTNGIHKVLMSGEVFDSKDLIEYRRKNKIESNE